MPAGSHEHGGAGEAGCFREDRIGRRLFRRAGGGGRHKCEKELEEMDRIAILFSSSLQPPADKLQLVESLVAQA